MGVRSGLQSEGWAVVGVAAGTAGGTVDVAAVRVDSGMKAVPALVNFLASRPVSAIKRITWALIL
jgi:hypothetical protein